MSATRALALCLALVPLTIGLLLSSSPQVARAADTAMVVYDLNLRTGPSTDFDVIAVMPAGSTVALTGEEVDGFYGVVFDDTPGWAFGESLDVAASAPVPNEPAPNATVVAVALNVRAAPGLDMDIVAILDEGARVAILGGPMEVDGLTWVEIAGVGGIQGWAAAEYLEGDGTE
jgi:uncharacterized protein YraI